MNLADRRKSAKEHEFCYNCLNPSHNSKECKSAWCKGCEGKKHNSLLCPENPFNRSVNALQLKNNSKKKSNQPKTENQTSWLVSNACSAMAAQTFPLCISVLILPTAMVKVFVDEQFIGIYRALCDTGSVPNLVKQRAIRDFLTRAMNGTVVR